MCRAQIGGGATEENTMRREREGEENLSWIVWIVWIEKR